MLSDSSVHDGKTHDASNIAMMSHTPYSPNCARSWLHACPHGHAFGKVLSFLEATFKACEGLNIQSHCQSVLSRQQGEHKLRNLLRKSLRASGHVKCHQLCVIHSLITCPDGSVSASPAPARWFSPWEIARQALMARWPQGIQSCSSALRGY